MENATASIRLHTTHKQWDMVSIDKKLVTQSKGGKRDPVQRADKAAIFYTFEIERHSAMWRAMIFGSALIMISINLFSLWLDLRCEDRIRLLSLNFIIHVLNNQHIFWSVPYNGDIIPDIVVFFRDSLNITAVILLGTAMIRGMARFESLPPLWIESTNSFLVNNPVGLYFSVGSLEEKMYATEEDGQTLVESNGNEPVAKCNGVTKENLKWRQFAKILDRLLFAVCLIGYIILFALYIPAENK